MHPVGDTEYFRSGGATPLNFIVDTVNAGNSFAMRPSIPWHAPDARQRDVTARILADVNVARHDALERSVVNFETRLEQPIWAMEAAGADSVDVSIWGIHVATLMYSPLH